MKGQYMKAGSTLILRIAIYIIGLAVLGLCIFLLPVLIGNELGSGDFDFGPVLIGMYVPAVPFFWALYQGLRLLDFIDKNKAFSASSVLALRTIKRCGLIISGLYALGMPYIFYLADRDDAPGVALIGFIIIGASFTVATFAATLQRLLQNAIAIKKENDLTV
jgi:hypothetical protein